MATFAGMPDAKKGRKGRRSVAAKRGIAPLSNVDRGRLMVQTAASLKTIDAWWRGDNVRPVTRHALEEAAKKLRLMVPHTRATEMFEEKQGKRESRRPVAAP